MIPVAHAYAAADAMPDSRLEIFETAGHFPFNHHSDALDALAPTPRSRTGVSSSWHRLFPASACG